MPDRGFPHNLQSKSSILQILSSGKAMRALLIMLILPLFFCSSLSRSIVQSPHSVSNLKINRTQSQNAGTCSFTVSIRTSCSSTRYTRDRISISFGDAYGNQVYAPRLDDPSSRTFESCSTDTFQLYGPCTYQICYLYLYRSGRDGWIPYDVTVHGYNSQPVSFYYNVMIPGDTWYGFNNCRAITTTTSLAQSE